MFFVQSTPKKFHEIKNYFSENKLLITESCLIVSHVIDNCIRV